MLAAFVGKTSCTRAPFMDWGPSTHRLLLANYAPPESPFNSAAA